MNAIHFHLILNHFPTVGFIIVLFVFLHGLYRKNEEFNFVSLWFIIILSFITIFVYLSGEGAEELLKNKLDKGYIETHESFGKISLYLSIALGILSAFSLITKRFRWLVLILLIINILSLSITSFYGGQIRHEEIRNLPIKKEVKNYER